MANTLWKSNHSTGKNSIMAYTIPKSNYQRQGSKACRVWIQGKYAANRCISFIEHISFDNFDEGTRLKSTIEMQKRYFGKCHQTGADAIYATKENRSYCTKNNIDTSFVQKGKDGKEAEQKKQMQSLLGKVRSTVLEGSFGNEKNHYMMDKIKAKTRETERVWIFFSLLTSNARQTDKRIEQRPVEKQAAQV